MQLRMRRSGPKAKKIDLNRTVPTRVGAPCGRANIRLLPSGRRPRKMEDMHESQKIVCESQNGLFDKFLGTHRKTAHTPPGEKGVEKPTSEAKQNECKKQRDCC